MLETRKAELLDLVELREDFPEYGVKRGEQGVVVEVFDHPDEAYILEFADPSDQSLRLAYWVKPNQIKSTEEIAKGLFEDGINLLDSGNLLDAETEFRKAIRLKSDYLGVLHNSLVRGFEGSNEWQRAITAMLLVFRISPGYEIARNNLAIAFQKYGIQKAHECLNEDATELFQMALTLGPSAEVASDIRTSLSAVFTSLGIREHECGRLVESLQLMNQANMVDPKEKTRRNVGVAYVHLAQFFLDNGKSHDAIVAFHRAELTGVMSAPMLNDYGVALAQTGEENEALKVLERALERSPNVPIIEANLNALRNNLSTNLSKLSSDAEFISPDQDEDIVMRSDFSPAMPKSTYSINLRNFAAA